MSAPITGCARQAFEANRQAQLARAESGDPSDGKVVPIDTREHGAIQHTHCHTEYREQGATRYGELQMVDSLVQQRSAVVGMSRHTHAYELFGAIKTVTSYANLVAFAQPERNKLTLDDYAVREPVESQRNKQRTWDMSPEQIDPLETTWRKAYADAALDVCPSGDPRDDGDRRLRDPVDGPARDEINDPSRARSRGRRV